MKSVMAAAAIAFLGTPALAQQAAPATSVADAPVDHDRLVQGRIVAAKLLPPGVYRKIMGGTMSAVTAHMGDTIGAVPLKQLAELGGLDAKQAAALDKVNVQRVMAIYDPHWQERMQRTMTAMFDAMGDFFSTMEPELREAYARAYARQFTLPELQDLVRFFDTPSGAKFADRYVAMTTDPAILNEMQALMPKMMKQMPAIVASAQKATASLPPPRTLKQLTPAERAELAKALGVPESQLRDPAKTP